MTFRTNYSYFGIALLAVFSLLSCTIANASNHDLIRSGELMRQLDRENKVKTSRGASRLKDRQDLRCKSCEERERQARFEYLSRAIAAQSSSEYQKRVKKIILADEKFVKNCWSRLSKREIEVFFTINEDGKAEDFAWFPKKTYGKCLSKHVTKIEFPKPEKAHYSWMVTSDVVATEEIN